jgi:molybdenum cofactor guanylyltransferase
MVLAPGGQAVADRSLVTVALLAGGRGRRLGGVPKGLIQHGERTVIEHLVAQLPEHAFACVIANRPEPYEFLELPIVGDVEPERGAPGGVVTALAVSATPWTLVVACDMPNVTRAAIESLLQARRPEVDAVCFARQGELEPLLALYRRTLLGPWAEALGRNASLRELLGAARRQVLPAPTESLLDSLNTPEDLARIGARPP